MRRLTIDWLALELAFEVDADGLESDRECFLDAESGEVIFIDEEVRSAVNSIEYELQSSFDAEADWTDERIRGTRAFQLIAEDGRPSVLAAVQTDFGDSSRFERVPCFGPRESRQWMRDFIETVDDGPLRSRLGDAVSQRTPFRQLRDVLAEDRRVERQWRQFEAARRRETIVEWLRSIGVQPANADSSTYSPPPLPDLRNIMFAEVRRFVRFARDLDGVRRIAMIGSLAEDEEFPKDIELLVTVSPDCDLSPLAKLARQLAGHMNSHRAGADVFLAGEDGEYIGRTCPWKDCGPGIRASCDARHCGRRHHLHDDFDAVRLKKAVIADPPVLLWPDPAATPGVPADVRGQLIQQLADDDHR